MGAMQGSLADASATDLGATAVKAAVERAGVSGDDIDRIYMGCVLPAGLGQAPARQAAIKAGLPKSVQATTVNKVCGSGMQTVIMAEEALKAGNANLIVAGGMESMTNAPHLLNGSRTGTKYGTVEMLDHMAWDGLTNPYDKQAMGVFGESCVEKYAFTREEQDAYAGESVRRAQAAVASGAFKDEIVPVTVAGRKGDVVIDTDEQPGRCDIAKIPSLKPAFKKDGTITAASSSSINDGAAATVVMSSDEANKRGLKPLAKIVAHATHSQAPEWFTTAPVTAIANVLEKAGWDAKDVDLFEVNEAFACVAMAPMRELGIAHDKLNVNGGACALGHPIGASGARLIVTLLHALKARGGKRGVAALCIGGGEATAVAVELA
jgi:acetyl-CoA C-acetyltransferase